MARRQDKSRREKAASGARPQAAAKQDVVAPKAKRPWYSAESIRETVESLVIALVFAFLLRTFAVEAFVIPTGSMATTLMGRHKDVTCPKCGYLFQINAGQELDKSGAPTGLEVVAGTCPMCRFTMDVSRSNTLDQSYPSYAGDRIMADRSSYFFKGPERWDVTVFHYPLGAEENYIKRLVGLPNETVRVQQGDVWIRPQGAEAFSIARKPPEKILATMRPVYDNDYVLAEQIRQGWPARWASLNGDGWKASEDFKAFRTDGTAAGEVWLGYRHAVPGYEDWAYLTGMRRTRPPAPSPQLITDFLGYDTEELWPPPGLGGPVGQPRHGADGLGMPPYPRALGLNWVSDLILEFTVKTQDARGELLVNLVKGGQSFRCQFDLEKGTATLSIPGAAQAITSASAAIRGSGEHRVRLANVDEQLVLWVDGRLVPFDGPTSYDPAQVDTSRPDQEDLTPARIGARGAAVEVTHVKLFRDIYYVAVKGQGDNDAPLMTDFERNDPQFPFGMPFSADQISRFFADPSQWEIFARRRSVEFALHEDQYFMLGDNSPESWDGRLWGPSSYFVSGDLLIGQAVFLYWPHSWNRIPGTPIPFPFFPNFARMGRIH